jgi:hypothetical protein
MIAVQTENQYYVFLTTGEKSILDRVFELLQSQNREKSPSEQNQELQLRLTTLREGEHSSVSKISFASNGEKYLESITVWNKEGNLMMKSSLLDKIY